MQKPGKVSRKSSLQAVRRNWLSRKAEDNLLVLDDEREVPSQPKQLLPISGLSRNNNNQDMQHQNHIAYDGERASGSSIPEELLQPHSQREIQNAHNIMGQQTHMQQM